MKNSISIFYPKAYTIPFPEVNHNKSVDRISI